MYESPLGLFHFTLSILAGLLIIYSLILMNAHQSMQSHIVSRGVNWLRRGGLAALALGILLSARWHILSDSGPWLPELLILSGFCVYAFAMIVVLRARLRCLSAGDSAFRTVQSVRR